MKLWILLAIAGALLVWALVRERFEATASIKAPPYDAAEKRRIFDMVHQRSPTPPYSTLGYQDILMDKAKQQLPNETNADKLKEAAGAFVTPAIESFFNTVFKSATTPITDAQVDSFVDARASDIKMVEKDILKTYFVGQSGVGTSETGGASSYAAALAALGQGPGYLIPGTGATGGTASGGGTGTSSTLPSGTTSSTAASAAASVTGDGWEEGSTPVCPMGTSFRTVYSTVVDGNVQELASPVEKCYGADIRAFSCPAGYESALESGGGTLDKPCRRQGGTETAAPQCPAGFEYNPELGACETTPVDPTCPGGYQYREGKCMRRRSPTSSGPATTTGGSTTSVRGPTTGGPTDRLRQVFGPQFTERSNEVPRQDGDSSKSNVYPELLGGMMDKSTRIPGVGVTSPSRNWSLTKDGSLPSSASLGSDEMSRFFAFSRVPGDQDVIPDPYRLAKTFSASSYSSKTEPAPFLTDFSAFLQ